MDTVFLPSLDLLNGAWKNGGTRGIEKMKSDTRETLLNISIVALSVVIAFSMIQLNEERAEICERNEIMINDSSMETDGLTFSQIECVNKTTGQTYIKEVRPLT